MGNSHNKKDQVLVSYKFQLRKDPIAFKVYDDFPYPKKPKNIEIEDQLQNILKNCLLTKEQTELIKTLTFDIKWKLICKHRFMILTGLCDYRQARKSISQFYVESIRNSNSMLDLDHFFTWLSKEAKETDITSFLNYGGLKILLDLLENAEICSRSTKNHAKQILILKILNFLKNFPKVVDNLVNIPHSATKIFMNFNLQNWEISKYVLQLLNDYIWNSEEGQKDFIQALNNYKNEFTLKFRLEPFIDILKNSKNIIMLESILAFINALIESPEEEQHRTIIRSEFSGCGIKNLISVIKEKIEKEEYKLEDCSYKAYLEECQENEFLDHVENQDGGNTSRTTLFFAENEDELFSKKQISVLKQIEILENGFLECMEDVDEESESDSITSFLQETDKISISKEKMETKSLRSIAPNKTREIDFSDVNDLFNRARTKSLENDNYEDFLAIMQHFCLIPANENGKKVWKKIREAMDEMNGLGRDERMINLGKLKKMIENHENLEDLQNKITFLNTQLSIRDEEIRQLHYKIKEAEFSKQTYKSSNALLIKTLAQEKENIKSLNTKILENELRSSRLLKEKEDKVKRLDAKVKELSRNLSYTPKNNPSQFSPSKLKKQETFEDKKDPHNSNGTLGKSPQKVDKSVTSLKGSLKSINEKEETIPSSENSFKLSLQMLMISVAVQTEDIEPSAEKEKLADPLTNLEIIPSLNNNLSNLNEIIANSTNDPIGQMLMKSRENIENEMLQSLKASNLDENSVIFRRNGHSIGRSKDQIIENLTKRVKELENLINNIPNRISGKEEKTPKSILRNAEGEHTFRSRGTSANHSSMKSIQFKMDDGSSPMDGHLMKDKFDIIKEDDKENRTSLVDDLNDLVKKKQSIIISEEQLRSQETKEDMNVQPPPPPPPPLLPFLLQGNVVIPNLEAITNKPVEGPVKEKKAPNVPMKQVCWTCVNPNSIEYTVWERINENEVVYDVEDLEKQFTSKRPDKKQPGNVIFTNKNVKVTLLSLTRSKNISIALSKLKMSLSAISDAVLKLDQNVLKLNVVGSLLEACPKEDEFNLVSTFEGDRSQLDLPEQFVLEMKNVPGFRVRLAALQFYLTYKELVEDFTLKTDKLTDLFENIFENDKFQLLLKYTLALGNYFNGTGQRGGAFGFKLDAFEKLVDMKSVDGKKTFLGYVIELIEKNTGESFIDSNEDLKIYDIGRKLPISQLISDLADIKKGLSIVNEAINSKSGNPFDNVEYFFSEFARVLTTNIQEFDYMIEELEGLYVKICDYYCEDPKETPSDVFVEKVFKIWTACKKAKTVIVKEKEMMKKEEIRMKKMEEKTKNQNSYKLECPEELANYIQNRRMIRRKPEFEGRRYGSILKKRASGKLLENNLAELMKKE